MRLWSLVALAIVLWGIDPCPVWADAGGAGADRTLLPPSHGVEDLHDLWRARREALLRQDLQKAQRLEAEIASLQRELDLPEIHLFAWAAIDESRQLEASAPAEAERRARFAAHLAPSLPDVHLQRLRTRIAAEPLDVPGWISIAWDHLRAIGNHPGTSRRALADAGISAALAFAIGGAILILGWTFRHGRRVIHGLSHLFRPWLTGRQTWLVFWVVPWLPLALGLGPWFVGLVLAAAIGAHLSLTKRAVIWSWLLGLALVPVVADGWASAVRWEGTRAASLHRLEREGALDVVGLEGQEPEVLFARARVAKRLGRWDEARHLYVDVLRHRPRWAPALVNLGNLDFLEGDHDAAEKRWAMAVGVDPSLAAAYFNLSRLHYEKGDIFAGQEARRRAVDLSPSLVERYTDDNGLSSLANRYLVDATLDPDEWIHLTETGTETLGDELARRLFGPGPSIWLAFSSLFFLPLSWWITARRSLSHGCLRCGRTLCVSCNGVQGALCLPCEALFVKRTGLDRAARKAKEEEVRAHERTKRLGRLISTALLAGPAVGGRIFAGIPLLLSGWFLVVWIAVPPADPIPPMMRALLALPVLLAVAALGIRLAGRD